jgi:DNA repair exonuclease SbcCD ATPase subunit
MTSKDIKEIVQVWKEQPIERFRENVECHERSIVRHNEEIQKLLSDMQQLDTNNKNYIDKMQRRNGDLKTAISFLKDDKALVEVAKPELEKVENELKVLEESKKPQFEVLRNFVEKWKVEAINYYIELLKNGYEGKDTYIIDLLEKGEKYIINLYTLEAKSRLVNMIMLIKEKTGEVISCNLYNQTNNQKFGFEGTIKGEKKTVKVEAILAGGWNIQKLHVRLLIN